MKTFTFKKGCLLSLLCAASVVVLSFFLGLTPGISFTEDLGRHLILGQLILSDWHIPATNFLTYTYPDFPFVNHHWLSEVFLFLLFQAIGYNGLIIFKGLLFSFLFGVLFHLCLKRVKSESASSLSIIWLTLILSCLMLSFRSHIRPELFTFVGIVVFLWLFDLLRQSPRSILFRILLLITGFLWANFHIYFIFGIGMAAAFALEQTLVKPSRKTLFSEIFWGLSLVLVCGIGPNGLNRLLYPFKIFSNYGVSVTENASPIDYYQYVLNPMLICLPLVFLMTIASIIVWLSTFKKRGREPVPRFIGLSDVIIASAALIALVDMARSAPLLALTFPLVVARAIPYVKIPHIPFRKTLANIAVASCFILSVGLIAMIASGSFHRPWPSPIGPTAFGLDSEDRFQRIRKLKNEYGLKGPIFSDYNIGSLLEYQLFPEKVYLDNRPEAFPDTFWRNEYFPAMRLGEEWRALVKKREINTVAVSLWGAREGFIRQLTQDPNWILVHLDEICAVWVRNNRENETIIKERGFTPKRYLEFTCELSQELLKLPDQPWWRRQIEAEVIAFKLYALVCVGQEAAAWPYIYQLYKLYPDYQIVHELIRATAPPSAVSSVESIFAKQAKLPFSAKQVVDWGNHLLANNRRQEALKVFQWGRIFFPLSQQLKAKCDIARLPHRSNRNTPSNRNRQDLSR